MGDALALEFASNDFMIVNHENGGLLDLFKFLFFNDEKSGAKFVETGGSPFPHSLTFEQRWVIVVSIMARKILKVFGKPMEWCGIVVEFILNLLYINGGFIGLMCRILHGIGNVEMPVKGSETFISAIGHIDPRVDLFKSDDFKKGASHVEMGDRALMDLCIMCSKLAYENVNVVTKVVEDHWKMHFVHFYNGWNEYEKEYSTQVFIMCDEAEDANLIVVSFRGTEPFDADDWITDFDYTWYNFHKLGKVHMGFLEALGLGTRDNTNSFQMHLQANNPPNSRNIKDLIPPMGKTTAYYTVRRRVKELLKQHENAKFVVTGHSLGGALAILFPTVLLLHEEEEMMQRLLGIYTFGQPRVGNRDLARYVEEQLERLHTRYFRVVYCTDLVPRLPYDDKTFLYKHFGMCLYYSSLYIEKEVVEEPNRNYFGLAYLIPDHVTAVWELLRSLVMEYVYGSDYRETWESFLVRLVGLAIPGVSAHCPLNYVNSIRLGRASSIVQRKHDYEY